MVILKVPLHTFNILKPTITYLEVYMLPILALWHVYKVFLALWLIERFDWRN
jgi:hypothetical protein